MLKQLSRGANVTMSVDRVAVFIDGMNVRHRLRDRGWCEDYDIGYLAKCLLGPRQANGIYFFHPQPNQEHLGPARYAAEREYLDRVMRDETVTAPPGAYMVKRSAHDGGYIWVEKQGDVLLATELVYMATKGLIDRAIVATADADLVPAVRRCVDLRIPVEILRFRGKPRIWELESLAVTLIRARPAFFQPYDRQAAPTSN